MEGVLLEEELVEGALLVNLTVICSIYNPLNFLSILQEPL